MNKKLILALLVLVLIGGYYFFFRPVDTTQGLKNFSEIGGRKIIAFGDSLTLGQGASAPQFSYPARLAVLRREEIVNLGKNGDTTVSALKRIDQALALNPGLVLITLGGNDLRKNLELSETLNSLDAIFKSLHAGGAAVAYLSIQPPLVGDNWSMAIKDIAKANGVLWVEDVMEDLWGDPEFMSDAVHPNDKGYDKIAARVNEAISNFLLY